MMLFNLWANLTATPFQKLKFVKKNAIYIDSK